MESNQDLKFDDKLEAYCYDCAQKDVKTRVVIKDKKPANGKMLMYKKGEEEIIFFKCDKCFENNPNSLQLKNQECEVYSRIVGYIRPTKQWNPGKQAEYGDRLNYKVKSL